MISFLLSLLCLSPRLPHSPLPMLHMSNLPFPIFSKPCPRIPCSQMPLALTTQATGLQYTSTLTLPSPPNPPLPLLLLLLLLFIQHSASGSWSRHFSNAPPSSPTPSTQRIQDPMHCMCSLYIPEGALRYEVGSASKYIDQIGISSLLGIP